MPWLLVVSCAYLFRESFLRARLGEYHERIESSDDTASCPSRYNLKQSSRLNLKYPWNSVWKVCENHAGKPPSLPNKPFAFQDTPIPLHWGMKQTRLSVHFLDCLSVPSLVWSTKRRQKDSCLLLVGKCSKFTKKGAYNRFVTVLYFHKLLFRLIGIEHFHLCFKIIGDCQYMAPNKDC